MGEENQITTLKNVLLERDLNTSLLLTLDFVTNIKVNSTDTNDCPKINEVNTKNNISEKDNPPCTILTIGGTHRNISAKDNGDKAENGETVNKGNRWDKSWT